MEPWPVRLLVSVIFLIFWITVWTASVITFVHVLRNRDALSFSICMGLITAGVIYLVCHGVTFALGLIFQFDPEKVKIIDSVYGVIALLIGFGLSVYLLYTDSNYPKIKHLSSSD